MAAVQFLNVLLSKEQVVYHNKGLGLLLRKAEGGHICTAAPASLGADERLEFALGFFSVQRRLSGLVTLWLFCSRWFPESSPGLAVRLGTSGGLTRRGTWLSPSREGEEKANAMKEVQKTLQG